MNELLLENTWADYQGIQKERMRLHGATETDLKDWERGNPMDYAPLEAIGEEERNMVAMIVHHILNGDRNETMVELIEAYGYIATEYNIHLVKTELRKY